MSSQTPPSPRTPQCKRIPWKHGSPFCSKSPSFIGGPDCCSTPSSISKKNGAESYHRNLWGVDTPPKILSSPISKRSNLSQENASRRSIQCFPKESDSEASASSSKQVSSTDPSWSKTFSSTDTNGAVTVELDFPLGGWDEESSSDGSSCSLEIVESEVDCSTSPNQRGRKRKQSEVSEEDNAILSGMGEEIERQLEAKAERNRLTVPNVKNILRSVITNPYVQAMVRRSIKTGDVAVSGDTDDVSFEPRLTRAKAKLLCDNDPDVPWPTLTDMSWTGTPQKPYQSSECQALISEDLNDDSEDDEEYQPCEDDPSDNDYSERDGSERGSERDISAERSPACFDTDNESCPPTPSLSPKLNITDFATQTNWSDDGVFKVPLVPPDPQIEQNKDENIALRTRSKLPLNDTPLEEIEQAFIPPDITPDLYDTTCDNADWQEFLNDFMQPMRSEPDVQNHDDDDDPEYNVLADEEIIDQEELRRDRAVKVSKRELNELMRELLEFTENMSSEDEDKGAQKDKGGNSEEMSLFLDAYMSLGTLTPLTACKITPPARSPSTPSLNTPVPPMSPPCSRTPGTGKKVMHSDVNPDVDGHCLSPVIVDNSSLKAKPPLFSPGKKQYFLQTPGKFNGYSDMGCDSLSVMGKPNIFVENGSFNTPSAESNVDIHFFSPGKDYFFQNSVNDWEKSNVYENAVGSDHPSALESQNLVENVWNNADGQQGGHVSVSAEVDVHVSDAESSVTLPMSTSSHSLEEGDLTSVNHEFSKLRLFKPNGKAKLSPMGDVIVDNSTLLSAAQRLVLDQQMRQYVQLLTQNFLQTYQHPVHGHYAPFCKEHLVNLDSMTKNKNKSAFKAANLMPALETIKLWENKFLTDEGPGIQRFIENEVLLARRQKNRRNRYLEKFPPQLMSFMADSTVFIYPQLLPTMPFRTHCEKKMFLPSEDHLLAIGLEEFVEYIELNNPGRKTGCLRWAMSYVTEYLLIGKDAGMLTVYSRKKRAKKGNALEYYFEHKCAPPTSHLVTPFCEPKMSKLRIQPHYLLPPLWRDFLYPAHRPGD